MYIYKLKLTHNDRTFWYFLQVVDAQFRGIGKPWTVPWTAETILQVKVLHIGANSRFSKPVSSSFSE